MLLAFWGTLWYAWVPQEPISTYLLSCHFFLLIYQLFVFQIRAIDSMAASLIQCSSITVLWLIWSKAQWGPCYEIGFSISAYHYDWNQEGSISFTEDVWTDKLTWRYVIGRTGREGIKRKKNNLDQCIHYYMYMKITTGAERNYIIWNSSSIWSMHFSKIYATWGPQKILKNSWFLNCAEPSLSMPLKIFLTVELYNFNSIS